MKITLESMETEAQMIVEEMNEQMSLNSAVYEVIDQSGTLNQNGVIVLNNVPVHNDAREKFEHRFLNRPKMIEKEKGFIAIRVMRPLKGDTYTILTQWESEDSFRDWQQSKAYQHAHKNRGTKAGIDQEKGVLKSNSNHHIYQICS